MSFSKLKFLTKIKIIKNLLIKINFLLITNIQITRFLERLNLCLLIFHLFKLFQLYHKIIHIDLVISLDKNFIDK